MSPSRKHQNPYGLIALGVLLIAISAFFMVSRSASRAVPGGFADRASLARDALFEGVAPIETSSLLPPIPRGTPKDTERKITKNGSLDLVVASAERATEKIAAIAKEKNGFVAESQIYEKNDAKTGVINIRVPAMLFESAFTEIKQTALEVTRENTNASDMTEQHADLEARIVILKAQEKQYLAILKTARTVEDSLNVTQYLNQVRSEIDQLEGQLQYLASQVDMAAISATLTEEANVEIFGLRWKPLVTLKQSFRAMLDGIAEYVNVMIALFFYLPVILLWGATIGVVLLVIWKIIELARK